MDEPDAKTIVIIGLGIVCLVVFLFSPLGDILFAALGLIPGGAWGWILGIAAVFGLIAVVRYFT